MYHKFLHCFVIVHLLFSCANSRQSSLKRRDPRKFFSTNGIEQYFLPNLPVWANRSSAGNCKRTQNSIFLNIKRLRNSFSLKYEEASQLQLMFNHQLRKSSPENSVDGISLQQRQQTFMQSMSKITAGIRTFKIPSYPQINLIWFDPIAHKKNSAGTLKKLLDTPIMSKGHPVLVSLCFSRQELQSYLQEKKLLEPDMRLLSYEIFSPYSLEGKLETYDFLHFNNIFSPRQKLHLFLPDKIEKPMEFKGDFVIHRY